jgi:hypothetical protein
MQPPLALALAPRKCSWIDVMAHGKPQANVGRPGNPPRIVSASENPRFGRCLRTDNCPSDSFPHFISPTTVQVCQHFIVQPDTRIPTH